MNKLGVRLTAIGALAQAVGLGIDAWRHGHDPTLAAREALVSFTNPGHMLLLGGIVLVLIGASMMVLGPRLDRLSRALRVAFTVIVVASVGTSSALAANSSLAHGHDHGDPPSSSVHGHGDGRVIPDRPLDPATRARLARQLVEARQVALRYQTVADAERAGYRAVTPYFPLLGAHFIRFIVIDGTFDIEQPEMLLYDGTNPTSRIVGLSYYVTGNREPEGFAGPDDHWHRHIGLCIDTKRAFVVGDEQTTAQECTRRGGVKVDGRTGWMLHVWVVPGWESPLGVFSAANPQLR